MTRFAAVGRTPALRDRAGLRFREAAFLVPEVRDADFLPVVFLAEDFFFAAPVARRRLPALRAVDFFRPDELLRPRAAEARRLRERVPPFLPLLELRRDDFLAAAMFRLRVECSYRRQRTIV